MPYRIVYVGWLKPYMDRILPNWEAVTIGHTIYAGISPLSSATLAHELVHVDQWNRYGLLFPVRYAAASVRAVLAGRHWYADNAYEVEARGE